MDKRIGIIAGDGRFPLIIAEGVRNNGYTTIVIAHSGLTSQDIEKYSDKTYWIKIGELSRLIKILKKRTSQRL